MKIWCGYDIEKFWRLGCYCYPFYRHAVERLFNCTGNSTLILDAGCGHKGHSLSQFSNKAFIGVDIDIKNIRSCHIKKLINYNYILCSITHLPFKFDIFDLIVNVDVLEHLEEKLVSFNEFFLILKKKGSLIGSTSNVLNPVLFFDEKFPRRIVDFITNKFAPGHYDRHNRLSPIVLKRFIKMVGFRRISITMMGFPPFNPWIYHYSNKKNPWFANLWVIFDIITNHNGFNIFKEMMVFSAIK